MKEDFNFYYGREGVSQRTRLDKNLLPENFQIDGRTAIDLANFAVEFSKSLNFYHENGNITQGWKNFFTKERFVVQYIIAKTSFYPQQKSFYHNYELISALTDKLDITTQLPHLIGPIFKMLEFLSVWNENTGLEMEESRLVDTTNLLKDENTLNGIIRICSFTVHHKLNHNWEEVVQNLLPDLTTDEIPQEYSYEENDLELLKSTFERIYFSIEEIIHQAKELIADNVSNQNVRPHIGLFVGFLKLYEVLKDRMNQITEKHLDYYYQEVLGLTKKGRAPDETYVRFKLNDKVDSYFLKKGTSLTGLKDNLGASIVYETIHDALLSNVKISGLYTCFVSQNTKLNYTGLPNRDNIVTDIFFKKHDPENIGSMHLFGEDQFFKAAAERTMETAQVGFIIASSHLRLAEGERTICFDLMATKESYKSFVELIQSIGQNENDDYQSTFQRIFRTAFEVYIVLGGVEKKYINYKVLDNCDINGITLELALADDDLPVTSLKNNLFKNQPDLNVPYVKVLLREESHIYTFPLVHELNIVNIKLRILVNGLSDLLLFNNYGQIDPSIPFQLFGAVPKINSYFLLGSKELFSKTLTNVDINIEWYQLPNDENGWADYFRDYEEKITNSDYKVQIEYLNLGVWNKIKSPAVFSLFEEENGGTEKGKKLLGQKQFKNLKLTVDPFENKDVDHFESYTLKTRNGYLKIELVNPEFAFGYEAYQKNIYNSIRENSVLTEGKKAREPNPPISPVVKNITVNYTAETEALSETGPKDDIQLFSLGPFGYKKRELKSSERPVNLLLDVKPEGHLMIGLNKYPEDGIINFFFNPRLSTVDSTHTDVPVPKWQFLKNNRWEDITTESIIIDNTDRFLQSGIISIKIPDSITNTHTLINDNLYWIKASVEKNSHIAPEIYGLCTNVARIKWNEQSDGDHLKTKMPENGINKMLRFDPNIESVEQLLQPFNGKLKETTIDYYERVSERLRHKNRAYTNWDYERLLLDKFPVIFKAKCFNARKIKSKNIIGPGEILVAVIPDITSPLVNNELRPKFGVNFLNKMQNHLQKLSSPFVKIKVVNPYYERIRVICRVKFTGQRNPGFYISELNKDLINYLNPWIGQAIDEQFGNWQYRSKIMSFINRMKYVEFVTALSVVKTNTEQGNFKLFDTAGLDNSTEVIAPELPWSILTSVEQHDITAIDNSEYQVPDARGIGNMKLGVDFGIVKKTNN